MVGAATAGNQKLPTERTLGRQDAARDDEAIAPGRLSKRQKRRRRKGAAPAAEALGSDGMSPGASSGAMSASSPSSGSPRPKTHGPPRRGQTRNGPAQNRSVQDASVSDPTAEHASPRSRKRRRRAGGGARTAAEAIVPKVVASEATSADRRGVAQDRPAPPAPAPSYSSGASTNECPAASSGTPLSSAHRPSEDVAEADRSKPPAYAALDLGTNNCRLLVAVPTRPGQFRVIDAFSRIVRLGEGLSRTGRLAAPAMDRAIAALTVCAQKLSARSVAGARLIATEACRAAANGEEFIERVKRETGLDLEIVSRETEARLAVSGCGSLVDRSAKGAVLFDIGGGSSEIALLDLRRGYSRRLSNHIVAWTSLQVGVVTLAERYGGRDVTPALFEAMIAEVEGMIAGFAGRDALKDIVGGENFHLLGTSGTVTTLAGVHLGLERYDRRQVDGLWLSDVEASELVARIAGWSFEERVANPCIGSDRADLVLAGCAILEAIRRVWPAPRLRVADRGLREGLLSEMMVADGVWRRGALSTATDRHQRTMA
ncbi:MAG: Ppx/GppA family phosphatase [Rhizobiaceae bacterium]|nr:Ppx/GppA family phosphatase [Rhizobiaceae bacterium]